MSDGDCGPDNTAAQKAPCSPRENGAMTQLSITNSRGTPEFAWPGPEGKTEEKKRDKKQASTNNGQHDNGAGTARHILPAAPHPPERAPSRRAPQNGKCKRVQDVYSKGRKRCGGQAEGRRVMPSERPRLVRRPRLFCSRGHFTRSFSRSESPRSPILELILVERGFCRRGPSKNAGSRGDRPMVRAPSECSLLIQIIRRRGRSRVFPGPLIAANHGVGAIINGNMRTTTLDIRPQRSSATGLRAKPSQAKLKPKIIRRMAFQTEEHELSTLLPA